MDLSADDLPDRSGAQESRKNTVSQAASGQGSEYPQPRDELRLMRQAKRNCLIEETKWGKQAVLHHGS